MGYLVADFDDRQLSLGGTPTIAFAQTTAGVLTTSSISGNDEAGQITVKTGTTGASGSLVTVTFGDAYTTAPKSVVVARNDTVTDVLLPAAATITTSGWVLRTSSTPGNSSTYVIGYRVNG